MFGKTQKILKPISFKSFNQQKLKELREARNRKLKNFAPTLVLLIVLFLVMLGLVLYVDPIFNPLAVYLFLIFLFIFLFLVLGIILNNKRRAFFISVAVCIFLTLRFMQSGNLIQGIVLIGIILIIELAIYLKNKLVHLPTQVN